jgi:hypothetical protein
MRITQIAPPWLLVPPEGYEGVERLVSNLTEGLVDRGHDVTLFAPHGSRTRSRLVSPFEHTPLRVLRPGQLRPTAATAGRNYPHDTALIHGDPRRTRTADRDGEPPTAVAAQRHAEWGILYLRMVM